MGIGEIQIKREQANKIEEYKYSNICLLPGMNWTNWENLKYEAVWTYGNLYQKKDYVRRSDINFVANLRILWLR